MNTVGSRRPVDVVLLESCRFSRCPRTSWLFTPPRVDHPSCRRFPLRRGRTDVSSRILGVHPSSGYRTGDTIRTRSSVGMGVDMGNSWSETSFVTRLLLLELSRSSSLHRAGRIHVESLGLGVSAVVRTWFWCLASYSWVFASSRMAILRCSFWLGVDSARSASAFRPRSERAAV